MWPRSLASASSLGSLQAQPFSQASVVFILTMGDGGMHIGCGVEGLGFES